jgi:hypothetical protein
LFSHLFLIPATIITYLLQTHNAINPFAQSKIAHYTASLVSELPFTAIWKQWKLAAFSTIFCQNWLRVSQFFFRQWISCTTFTNNAFCVTERNICSCL